MVNEYQNPLPIKNIGDPFILRTVDRTYYCYATSAKDGFKAWKSDDLVNWQEIGYIYTRKKNSWGISDFWAPEVIYYQEKYYLHYSARWGKNLSLRIGVAISDSPSGPFVDVHNRPMFDFGYAVIDGHVFIDDDGTKYLYYSRDCSDYIFEGRHESHLYVIRLDDDMVTVKGEPVFLTKPEQDWELRSGDEWRWNEGPFLLKSENKYFLMYSANFYASRDYSVGYAIAEKPIGPFTKALNNPILSSKIAEVSGPGHNSVTTSPDGKELIIVYHIHTDPKNPSGDRQVCIDKIGIQDGVMYVNGPTMSKQTMINSESYSFLTSKFFQ